MLHLCIGLFLRLDAAQMVYLIGRLHFTKRESSIAVELCSTKKCVIFRFKPTEYMIVITDNDKPF